MEFQINDRVEVVRLDDPYDPIAPGTQGTVDYVNEVSLGDEHFIQVGVQWDNGRRLMACVPPDRLRLLKPTGTTV